jgi:hypothetical protein
MSGARIALFALLALQLALLLGTPADPVLRGDEEYYVSKAHYLWREHTFPPAVSNEMQIERGGYGMGDWRPLGYPLFVALCSGGDFDVATLRRHVTVVQFLLVAAAIVAAFGLITRRAPRLAWPAALILGLAPWLYEYVSVMVPDCVCGPTLFAGMLLLAARRTFLGALVTTASFLFRPELIAIAVLLIAAALLFGRMGRRELAAGVAALTLVTAIHYAYRIEFTGVALPPLFGGHRLVDRGAFAWTKTWMGTEHETQDFVFGLTNGNFTTNLPPRAFANGAERAAVTALLRDVAAHGYSQRVDDAFGRLAEARMRAHPIRALVLPRIWSTLHLWINIETNSQTLAALKHVPRAVRLPLEAAALALRLALLAAFAVALVPIVRAPRGDLVLTLFAAFVCARTLLMGLALGWCVHRFVAGAWLPLTVCALASGVIAAEDALRRRKWRLF